MKSPTSFIHECWHLSVAKNLEFEVIMLTEIAEDEGYCDVAVIDVDLGSALGAR